MEKTNETIDHEDYRNGDGLLMCGRCGTPKEMRLSMEALGGRTAIVPIPCECMKRAEQERRERELAAERKRKTERMRTECFEGRSFYRNCTFEADDGRTPQITAICKGYADTFSRDNESGLLLWGKVGTGKSFYSSAIANRLIDLGFSALQTSVQDIVTHIESVPFNERGKAKSSLLKYDLLLIDDLGAHRSTEYMMGHVYDIIELRYGDGKPLVITTNLDPKRAMESDSDDAHWPRIFSRILERCSPIKFAGENRRKYKMMEMREEMRKRLGL